MTQNDWDCWSLSHPTEINAPDRQTLMMERTIEFLWTKRNGQTPCSIRWAKAVIESGITSPSLQLLAENHFVPEDEDALVLQSLREIGKSILLDPFHLNQEYERENIRLFFIGEIDGWTLIGRCCQQHWDNQSIDPGLHFWILLDEEASEYDGNVVSLKWHSKEFFDENLRATILESGRPLPPTEQ